MLVLSRKVNEQIIVGENILITVVSIRGNQVRIGLEAPPEVPIFREELQRSACELDEDGIGTTQGATEEATPAACRPHRAGIEIA
jgi:carbon storage regulator